MLDILPRITAKIDTWDKSPQVFKPKPKDKIMDTLALDYAKGTLNTIEANKALGHMFGLCEHEEHDYHADAYDWLEDVLDIQYLVSSSREYLGARLLLSWGGPNTWLDTRSGKVTVYWGSDSATVEVPLSFTGALDEALAELWEMGN